MTAWFNRAELAEAPAAGDTVAVSDVSDTAEHAQGTVKRITIANLFASLLKLAGGTLNGALTLGTGASIVGGDKVASALELKDIGETRPSATTSGAITRSFADGAVHEITLNGNASSLTISNPSASGISCTIEFIIKQDATGGRTWAHPSGTKWPGGVAPTLSTGANDINVVAYQTTDGGSTWLGYEGGIDFA